MQRELQSSENLQEKGKVSNMSKIKLIGDCVWCNKTWAVEVNSADLEEYDKGELVQNAFPYLTATERECLISGMCPTCQDKIFG